MKACTVAWLLIFLDLLLSNGSITLLGLGLRWLDHALWCFAYSHLAILLVGLRLWLRVAADVGL